MTHKPSIQHIILLAIVLTVLVPLTQAQTVHYSYDQAGRLTSVTYDQAKTIHYQYDNAGNLLKRRIQNVLHTQSPIGASNNLTWLAARCHIICLTQALLAPLGCPIVIS